MLRYGNYEVLAQTSSFLDENNRLTPDGYASALEYTHTVMTAGASLVIERAAEEFPDLDAQYIAQSEQ